MHFTVIHSEFLSPLPTNVDEFMGSLHSVFPHILDVNHLMKNIGPLRKMTNIPASISYLKNHYFTPIDMENLPQESEGNIHRHTVVKMGYLFAKLCSILKISDTLWYLTMHCWLQPSKSAQTFPIRVLTAPKNQPMRISESGQRI